MVKQYFLNIEIECWHHLGRVGLSEPSVCLYQSSPPSCDSIVLALDEMESEGPPCNRTLTFVTCQRKRAFSTFRLTFLPDTPALRVMKISCDSATATIEMTIMGLRLLRKSVMTWRDGREDFGVAPRLSNLKKHDLGIQDLASGELWFWGPSFLGP